MVNLSMTKSIKERNWKSLQLTRPRQQEGIHSLENDPTSTKGVHPEKKFSKMFVTKTDLLTYQSNMVIPGNCILIFTNKKKALFNSTAKDPCFPSTLKVVHFIFLDQVMYSNNNYYQGSFIRYPPTVPLST